MTVPREKITLDLTEWQTVDPEPRSPLWGMDLGALKGGRIAEDLTSRRLMEITELKSGLRIRTRSWVGRITLGHIDIRVRPKIEKLPLLALFRYGFQFKDMHLINRQSLESRENGIVEALIVQLVNETRHLLRRGLSRKYVRNGRLLAFPRGRIDIQAAALRCGELGAGLTCIVHPLQADTSLNRTLLAGLKLAAGLSEDRALTTDCRRLIGLLDETVSPVPLTGHLVDQTWREQNRLTSHYNSLLILIQILMSGRGLWMEGEKKPVGIPGFLFDMNRLFQTVLFRFLGDNLPNFSVLGEKSLKGMMAYLPGFNPNNKKPPLPRPDFIIKDATDVAAVLDAKYRDLWANDLPREMLYQLGMYAMGHQGLRRVAILYPTTSLYAKEARIGIKDSINRRPLGEVALRPVPLTRLVELIEAGGHAQARRERGKYAQYMAFG